MKVLFIKLLLKMYSRVKKKYWLKSALKGILQDLALHFVLVENL